MSKTIEEQVRDYNHLTEDGVALAGAYFKKALQKRDRIAYERGLADGTGKSLLAIENLKIQAREEAIKECVDIAKEEERHAVGLLALVPQTIVRRLEALPRALEPPRV